MFFFRLVVAEAPAGRADALQHLQQPGWKTQILPERTKKTLDMGLDSPSTSSPQPKTLYLKTTKKLGVRPLRRQKRCDGAPQQHRQSLDKIRVHLFRNSCRPRRCDAKRVLKQRVF
jgi:hypothetical protein